MTLREPPAPDRVSSAPVGRSLGFERGLMVLIGLVALAAGITTLVVGSGVLGEFRARRPVLDPLAVRWFQEYPQVAIPVAVLLGVLLLLIGLWWMARALRPDPRPDFHLDTESSGELIVRSSALTDAIRTDAETLSGVTRARVRMAGTTENPALRMTLSLQEGTNVRQVWEELDHEVLSRARAALETETVPTAIWLVLDKMPRQRVR